MGELPVLEHAAKRFNQSGAILDYPAWIAGKHGAANKDGRREVRRRILVDTQSFTAHLASHTPAN